MQMAGVLFLVDSICKLNIILMECYVTIKIIHCLLVVIKL